MSCVSTSLWTSWQTRLSRTKNERRQLMRTLTNPSRQHEFYFPGFDNLVLVENRPDGVVIRATRDNFSEARKSFFIRELAAEGFIPDACGWFSSSPPGDFFCVCSVFVRPSFRLH